MLDVVQQNLFDYASLDADTRKFVQEITEKTHILVKQTDDNIVQIGNNIQAVKDKLSHGQFYPWLAAEFDWTVQTAANFMNYARLADKNKRLLDLPREVGYVLGQRSMPDAVIEKVLNEEIPPTIAAIREAKQEAQVTNIGHGISELYSRSQGNPTLYTIPVEEAKEEEKPEETEEDRYVRAVDTGTTEYYYDDLRREAFQRDEEERTSKRSGVPAALQSSESNEWYTPEQYVNAARELMGDIDIDPASNEYANGKVVHAATYYDISTNGLDKPWHGRVWLNPPYGYTDGCSNQEIWTKRLIEQLQSGVTTEAVVLVNAVTDRKWFQPLWEYLICFTDHRIRFYNTEIEAGQPTHGNALIYLVSPEREQTARFISLFKQFGPIARRIG